jgi:hypothetical protein
MGNLKFREAWSRGFVLIIAVAIGCFGASLMAYVTFAAGGFFGLEGSKPLLPACVVFASLAPWFIGLGSREFWSEEHAARELTTH